MSEDVKPYGAVSGAENSTPDELRALIAQTGLSQRKAAEALDLDERTVRYYASGQKPIPRVVIYALRHLASQVQPMTRDGELPEGQIYLIHPAGKGVLDLTLAIANSLGARSCVARKQAEGEPQEVWRAFRVDPQALAAGDETYWTQQPPSAPALAQQQSPANLRVGMTSSTETFTVPADSFQTIVRDPPRRSRAE